LNSLDVIAAFKKRSKPLTMEQLEVERRYSPTKLDVRAIGKRDQQYLLRDLLGHLPEKVQASIWLDVYQKSPYRNLDSIGIDFFKARSKRKTFSLMDYADPIYRWVGKIDCWKTGDMLANLTSTIHELDPEKYYPKLEKWANIRKPWLNRMSLLSLYYYAACRQRYPGFDKSLNLLEPQLGKDDYYLQKAVGWTLREMSQAHPKKTIAWIDRNLNSISPHAYSAATEKVAPNLKENWRTRRRIARLNSSK